MEAVKKIFDYDFAVNGQNSHDLDSFTPPTHFTIGLISGVSGCGKTKWLQSLAHYHLIDLTSGWDENKTVIENIDTNPEDSITKLLSSGFSSVPQWFLKYSELSEGQKFRAGIAKHLIKNQIAIDEFTSKLDRLTARNTAHNVHQYAHTKGLNCIIVASLFRDIIPYLRPDWIYDMSTKTYIQTETINSPKRWSFQFGGDVLDIDSGILSLVKSDMKAWEKYKRYHYLSSSILNNGEYWELYTMCENIILAIGYIVVTPLPLKDFRAKREHRLVILPEVQGMGIGVALSEFMGEHYTRNGYRYYCKTSHPKLGVYRNKHPEKWRPSTYNGKVSKGNKLSDRLFRKRNGLPYQSSGEEVNEVIIDMKTNKPIQKRFSDGAEKVYYCHEYYTENSTSAAAIPKQNKKEVSQSQTPSINDVCTTLHSQGWKPSTMSGVMTLTNHQVIVRFRQKKTYFRYSDYSGSSDNATKAATQFLELSNMTHLNPNLIRHGEDGTILLMVDTDLVISFHTDEFHIIKDKKLSYRRDTTTKRIYLSSMIDNRKKRIYLDDIMKYTIVDAANETPPDENASFS